MQDAKFIDKLGLVHIVDGKLLVVMPHGKDAYLMPGGKREGNETDIEALTRELQEELTINFNPDSAEFVEEYTGPAHGKPADVVQRIRCYKGEFSGELVPGNEIEKFGWINLDDIEKPYVSEIGRSILKDLQSKGLLT